jgi:hypothetical protein
VVSNLAKYADKEMVDVSREGLKLEVCGGSGSGSSSSPLACCSRCACFRLQLGDFELA